MLNLWITLSPFFGSHFFRHLGARKKRQGSHSPETLVVCWLVKNWKLLKPLRKFWTFDINQSSNRCRDELERPGALARCLSLTASRGASIPLGLSAPGTFICWFQSQHLVEENSHHDGDWDSGKWVPQNQTCCCFLIFETWWIFRFFCELIVISTSPKTKWSIIQKFWG